MAKKSETETTDKGTALKGELDQSKAGLTGQYIENKGFPGGRDMADPIGFDKIKGPSIGGTGK